MCLSHNMHMDQTIVNEYEVQRQDEITWITLPNSQILVSGLIAYEKEHKFERFPAIVKEQLKSVNPCLTELGENTAGAQLSFRSDTRRVIIKAKLKHAHNMVNMAPTGQCGFDCYIGKNKNDLTFFGVTKYDCHQDSYMSEIVNQNVFEGVNEFLINFPLYCNVEELMIGIDQGATLLPPSEYAIDKKVVFYGTSITQGGCATRPGMAYTNMVTRRLNVPHYNFGFSANGLGEYEMADFLASIPDPALYILDYEANAGANGRLEASLEGFIKRLRAVHKETPILVLSRIPYTLDRYDPEFKQQRDRLREFQRSTVDKLKEQGDQNIYFMDGTKLFPKDCEEFTVDFIHPTDLGFYHMTNALEPVIKQLILG